MSNSLTISDNATQALLGELCVRFGFCLGISGLETVSAYKPTSAEEFTDAVILAEGLVPDLMDRHLYRQIKEAVFVAFCRENSKSQTSVE